MKSWFNPSWAGVCKSLVGRLCVLAATLSCATAVQAADPLKVGLVLTYSGPSATSGQVADNLIKVFQKRYGTTINGRAIELVRRDTGGPDPARVRQIVQDLLTREKVSLMVGPDFTPNVLAVAPLVTTAKVPTLITGAATGGIIGQRSPYLLRTFYTAEQATRSMTHWMYKNGVRRPMLVVADFAPGHQSEAIFTKAFRELGGTEVQSLRVPMRNPEFSGYLQRIKDAKPDAVYVFLTQGETSNQFLKAYANAGLLDSGIRLFADSSVVDETTLDAAGDAALGLISPGAYSTAHISVLNRQMMSDYTTMFGKQAPRPGTGSVAVWDAMRLIYDGVAAQGSAPFDPDKFMAFAKGRKFESPRGTVSIDATSGDMVQNIYVRRVERNKEGVLVNNELALFSDVAAE